MTLKSTPFAMDIDAELHRGLKLHRAGMPDQARQAYARILKADPFQPDALHLCGVAALDAGCPDEAITLIEKAIQADPHQPAFYNNLGNARLQKGQTGRAIRSYQQAIRQKSDYAEAFFNLGNAFYKQGDDEKAAAAYRQALTIDPQIAQAWFNLGRVLRRRGELRQALDCFEKAYRLKPDYLEACDEAAEICNELSQPENAAGWYQKSLTLKPNAWISHFNLANIYREQGSLQAALQFYQTALKYNPCSPETYLNMGIAYKALGDFSEARFCYQQSIQLAPQLPEAYYNLGNLFQETGHLEMAVENYHQVLKIDSHHSATLVNLANAYQAMGQSEEAQACFQKVLLNHPQNCSALINLGNILVNSNRGAEALELFQKAIRLEPQGSAAYVGLDNAFRRLNRTDDAVQFYRHALTVNPENARACFHLGLTLQSQANHRESRRIFKRAMEMEPEWYPARWQYHLGLPLIYQDEAEIEACRRGYRRGLDELSQGIRLDTPAAKKSALEAVCSHSNFYLPYQGRDDRGLQEKYGRLVNRIMAANFPQWSGGMKRKPARQDGKSRIGYISAHLKSHTVGRLFAGWIKHIDRGRFETFCYLLSSHRDEVSQQYARCSDHFCQLRGDVGLAAGRIAADNLDALIYLDIGMYAPATALAGLRLAPVQCAAWGHPVTTGLETVDYFLSSELMEPQNAQIHYNEQLVCLPNLSIHYERPGLPKNPKTRGQLGLRPDAFIYLSPQSVFKYLPQYDRILARIARQVPEAAFVFIGNESRQATDVFRRRLSRAFENFGLDFSAFGTFLPRMSTDDYFSLNLAADVLLDTPGWSGGKTTLEGIACGLPVITLPGQFMRGRHAYGMLKMMELDATIAADENQYVAIAVRAAHDRDFYQMLQHQTERRSGRIFEDLSCVRALEDFLIQALEQGARPPAACLDKANALRKAGRLDDALDCYQRALAVNPDDARCLNNIGNIFKEQRQYAQARAHYLDAIEREPENADYYYNLALVCHLQGDLGRALEYYRKTTTLQPGYAEAHNNLGKIYHEQQNFDAAVASYQKAIDSDPDYAEAHFNRSLSLLIAGRWTEGFRAYEWRFKCRQWQSVYPHRPTIETWDGSRFDGKRLLVFSEQGIGDTLQFIRYLPAVKARGGKVIFETFPALLNLLRGFAGIDTLVGMSMDKGQFEKCDLQIPLMSLARIFATTVETVPHQVPYIQPDPRGVQFWAKRIPGPDLNVGLVWAGKPTHEDDHRRSCALKLFAPLLSQEGVRFVGLQKGPAAAEVKTLPSEMRFTNLDDSLQCFADTAAAMACLDLVISVDTAVAHLAGAMGRPVWLLLPYAPDWRWLTERTDSPWYPSMRLFRQPAPGNWAAVIENLGIAMEALSKQKQKQCQSEDDAAGIRISEDPAGRQAPALAGLKADSRSQSRQEQSAPLYLGLRTGSNYGWGVCSAYLIKELAKLTPIRVVTDAGDSGGSREVPGKLFQALTGVDFAPLFKNTRGRQNYGYTFFENELTRQSMENARRFDLVIAGSTWCRERLTEKGIENCTTLIQGIDPRLFYPLKQEVSERGFVIFSGGKFELRKGQDLVLRAVKILQQKYRDIVLVNCWYNLWPQSIALMAQSPHIKLPGMQFDSWTAFMNSVYQANGLDPKRIKTFELVDNRQLRELYRQTDIGVFPNRCEGGTNLVLMEYMACARPVIASDTSGHRDIVTADNALLLKELKNIQLYDQHRKLIARWQEPSLDELVARIEYAYHHREAIQQIGRRAGQDLKNFTWEQSARNLLRITENDHRGQPEKTRQAAQRALKVDSGRAGDLIRKGCLAQQRGDHRCAVRCLSEALEHNPPEKFRLYNNLGVSLQALEDLDGAIGYYEKAVVLNPGYAPAWYNLGNACMLKGHLDRAIASLEKTVEIQPDHGGAWNLLVSLLQKTCDWKKLGPASARLDELTRRALVQGEPAAEAVLLNVARHADPALNFELAKNHSRTISGRMSKVKVNFNFSSRRSAKDRIVVGYLSEDFRNHPIGHLTGGLYGHHDRRAFKVYAYSYGRDDGSVYRREIMQGCDRFVDIRNLNTVEAARRIYEDQVDILVELGGHTAGSRLDICALRPAPVQVTYLGFPGTTGADFMDYIITDQIVSPEEHSPFYSEKIAYLPHCYQINNNRQPISERKWRRQDFQLPETGLVFSSFNQAFKIDPVMFASWMKILKQVPGSVLWLLHDNEPAKKNLRRAAAQSEVDPRRLIFAAKMSKEDHLGRLRLADLALDTRIYNGHTTTSDCLWAGVPVITLKGEHFASRVSASILSAMDLAELVVDGLDGYEELAIRLARSTEDLETLKTRLRHKPMSTPVFDTRRFVRNLEKAYRQMWDGFQHAQLLQRIQITEDPSCMLLQGVN